MSLTKASTVLLSSGHRMPIFGLGTWQVYEKTAFQTLNVAIKAGYRLIDSATSYNNEALIGSSLKKVLEDPNAVVARKDLFITTKLPPNGMRPENVEYFLRNSLKDLNLDYIDLYLIHFPIPTKRTDKDSNTFPIEEGKLLIDEDVDFVKTWTVMESFVDLGLVKSIGLSNFNSEQIQRIYDKARIKPAVLQAECHAYLPQFELTEFCRKLNIAFIAFATLGTPGLPDYARKNYGVDYNPKVLLSDPKLETLNKSTGKTPAQILLRYLVERDICVIPKSDKPERITSNMEIFDFSLTDEEKKILRTLACNFRYYTFDFHPSLEAHSDYPFKIPF